MNKSFNIFLILLLLAGSLFCCTKKVETLSQNVYYVVGYDDISEVMFQNGTSAKSETFLFVSENLKDSLFAYNWNPISNGYYDVAKGLFDVIDIPAEIWAGGCGIEIFPEEYRFAHKVQITFRSMTKEEDALNLSWGRIILAICPPNSLFQKFNPVIITSISKIQ